MNENQPLEVLDLIHSGIGSGLPFLSPFGPSVAELETLKLVLELILNVYLVWF